jgi:hypothetical protein
MRSVILEIVRYISALPPLTAAVLLLTGCSESPPETKPAKVASPYGPGPATSSSKNPLAKFIELAGFRLSEKGAGKLQIKFTAVNHSDADLEEMQVHVRLVTTAAKPGDEPVAEFDAKIPGLGPQEEHEIVATTTTKLRLYEMPDWQFLRAEFDITSPAP